MKIFFRKNDIETHIHRKFYAEWIKPIFPRARHKLYGLQTEDLVTSESIEDSDMLILPLTWNYYLEYGKLNVATKIIKEYERYKKPILTWASGDYSLKIPEGNYILLQHNLFKSKQKKNQYAYPTIIRDPLNTLKLYGIDVSMEKDNFSLNFCGIANKNIFDKLENKIKETLFRSISKIKRPFLKFEEPISGMHIRGEILKNLNHSNKLRTNIIIRNRKDRWLIDKQKYKFQYWSNIFSAPFTLCIRGRGNFSVRLYETLAVGRIPVIIDTDCVFPLENKINWKKHCIIIKNRDPHKAVEAIEKLIGGLSHTEIIQLQIVNRKLWKENLSFSGFYYSFCDHVYNNYNPNSS